MKKFKTSTKILIAVITLIVLSVGAVLVFGLPKAGSTPKYSEQQVSITRGDNQIPGILTLPANATSDKPAPAMLLLPGLMADKNEGGFVYQRLARKLAEAGYASLRIDFWGVGDSKVPYAKNNFDDSLADAQEALVYLKTNTSIDKTRIGVLGWSQGGRIAMVTASRDADIKALVTIAPASSNGKTDFEFLFDPYEAIAKEKGTVTVTMPWGSEAQSDYKFFTALANSRAMDEIKNYKQPMLVVQGDKDELINPSKSRELIKNTGSYDVTLRMLEGADHAFNVYADTADGMNPDQSMSDKLIQVITDWVISKL